MIESNPIVPIEVLTLEGIDAILRRNQRFLTENGVTFLPDYHEIKINFGKDIILRYADAGVRLKGIQCFVSTSQEKTGSFIRQVLRKEKASVPIKPEQLQFDFTKPLGAEIKASEETGKAISVVSATDIPPEDIAPRSRLAARKRREIEALNSRISSHITSLLVVLERKMWRSYRIGGLISILRENIAKYGYVRLRDFGWFRGDVLNLLVRWKMSDKRKEVIRKRLARISEDVAKQDALLRGLVKLGETEEYTGTDTGRNIILMLAGIESELRSVTEEMDGQSTLRQRYVKIANDLMSIQRWGNGQSRRPDKDLASCEAALRATAKYLSEGLHKRVLNMADKIAALKLPVYRAWGGNPPAGSIAGVFEYLCLQNITTSEISLSADDIARGLDLSYETIKYDLRALYYHLFLIKKTDTQGSGRDARYYVPESVKKKVGDIYPILERFVGKKLRPAKLDLMYAHKVIANLIGMRDSSAGELDSVKISRRTDDKGRFSIAVPGQKSKRFNIGARYALSDIEIAPLSTGWEKGFEVYHQGDLVGICDSSTGEFEPIQIMRRTDDKGRFSVTIPGYKSKRFNIGIDYASSGIELVPSYDDWAKGFIVFHKDNPVAIYDAKKDIFSLTFVVRRPDYKGRFILDGVRYNLGVNYARGSLIREVGIIPFYNFDWSGGFRVYHFDKEIASYDRRRNELVGISLAAKIPDTLDTLETETFDEIHDLFQAGVLAQTNDTAKILLSENLFIEDGDETELTQVRIALAPLLKSGYIAIMKPDDMRRAAMNQNVSKDKLAIVLTKEDFSNKEIWNGSDKETSLKSSVLILDEKLTGNNYLYLEGVIGLARAVMANNREAIRAYYELISGSAIEDEVMTLLDDAAQNNISFAIRAILRFKSITRIDPRDLNERRIRMENLLIAA